ncbi:hypothetical protein L0668_06310 [Paraglaciecola aquimarina]|uniref:ABC transporter permease n=1 Tax=Paraglaciecola algarum TaxID=3050085 RepID=A0ABS9D4L7_9ALTE|nr:hypothetical protein [Paraglaciecola sp. G1-23]MCF2947710.1 hypothetical protein [Paraglaciecola sp. G1-23]
MNPYLAIFRRDANTQNLNIPAPILYAFIIVPFAAFGHAKLAGGVMFIITLIASLKIIEDLKLADTHSLGFMLPNFKTIQFRYNLGLSVISAIISVVLLNSDLLQQFFIFTGLVFLISCLFLLVNKKVSIYIFHMFLAILLYSLFASLLGSNKNFPYLIRTLVSFCSDMFNLYPVVSSITVWAASVFNFYFSKKRYLTSREYDPSAQIYNWKKLDSSKNSVDQYDPNIVQNFVDQFFTYIAKLTKPLMDFVFFGRKQNPMEIAIYGNSYYSKNWSYLFLFVGFLLLVSYFLKDALLLNKDPKVALTGMYLFLLSIFYALTICLEFLSTRKVIPSLWLISASKNRTVFMQSVMKVFVTRHVRICICLSALIGIFHYLAIGTDSLLDYVFFALASLTVGFILPLCVTLLFATKLTHSVWLTIILVIFNIISYSIFSFIYVFVAIEPNRSLVGVLYLFICAVCLFFAVRMWRHPNTEIRI